ncbi:MAG: porin family protein [Castellaniella sp.]|uniref:surface lipoprotein assembly modifier n=1 Tax=Castellaniella sp. TaxID=1955812 RepID=UPI003C7930D8
MTIRWTPLRFLPALLLACALLPSPPARADEDDTRYLLDQAGRIGRQRDGGAGALAPHPGGLVLTIEGRAYRVNPTLQDLEPALYVAINRGQWGEARALADSYRRLAGHKPHLVLLADGLAARAEGDYGRAIGLLEDARDAAPGDARTQMELARAYAEDGQDRESRALFEQAIGNSLPPDTRQLLQRYVDAVDRRGDWQGSIAVGRGHNDNINQANGFEQCSMYFLTLCLARLKLPDPIASSFTRYDLVLSRRIALAGHHNLLLRPVSYGTFYQETAPQGRAIEDYSQQTHVLYAGYQYADARQKFSLLPFMELYARDGHTHYQAPGLQAEWSRALTPGLRLTARASVKRYAYKEQDSRYFSDYTQKAAGLEIAWMPTAHTSLQAGIDFTRRKYPMPTESGKDLAVRAGVFHAFGQSGAFVNLLALYRVSRNDERDFFLGVRRRDEQQLYIATLGSTRLSVWGVHPELRFKHVVNHSNSIFYGYSQNEVSLQLRKNF